MPKSLSDGKPGIRSHLSLVFISSDLQATDLSITHTDGHSSLFFWAFSHLYFRFPLQKWHIHNQRGEIQVTPVIYSFFPQVFRGCCAICETRVVNQFKSKKVRALNFKHTLEWKFCIWNDIIQEVPIAFEKSKEKIYVRINQNKDMFKYFPSHIL